MRPPTRDRQRKMVGKPAEVGVAVMRSRTEDGVTGCECSCGGFLKAHRRAKVAEDAAQRHLDKHHGGQAMWM